jgi:hypothetical protein
MRVSGQASRSGRAISPGKEPPVPIGQEAGWAPEPIWTQRLEKKILCLCRGSNLDRPLTELPRLRMPNVSVQLVSRPRSNRNARVGLYEAGVLGVRDGATGST